MGMWPVIGAPRSDQRHDWLPASLGAATACICIATDRAIADGAWLNNSHVNGSITYRVLDQQHYVDWSEEWAGDSSGSDWQWEGQHEYNKLGLSAVGSAFTAIDFPPEAGIGGPFAGFDISTANLLSLQFDGSSYTFDCYAASAVDCWFTVDTPVKWTWAAAIEALGKAGNYWFQLSRFADELIIAEDWREMNFHEQVLVEGVLQPGTYRVIAYTDATLSFNEGPFRTTMSGAFRLTTVPAHCSATIIAVCPALWRRSRCSPVSLGRRASRSR